MFDDIFPDWDDIALTGAMSEELVQEELERHRIEAERETDEDTEE